MNKYVYSALAIIALGGLVTLVVLSGNKPATKTEIKPLIQVGDQALDQSVVVDRVDAVEPSWLVIQTENEGVPGPVIGYTRLAAGRNDRVSVQIDQSAATPKLFAMIHEDTGEKDKFDFPQSDMPLIFKGDMVAKIFTATR